MKRFIYFFLYSLFVGLCLGEDFSVINKQVKLLVYSQVQTNWTFYTNTFEAYYGWNNQTNDVKTFFEQNAFYRIGLITSNNLCDVYYNDQFRNSTLLSSNNIGYIEIKYELQPVVVTNYSKLWDK